MRHASLVSGVTEFTESEGGIFKNYIFKCLRKLGEDKSLWVRICTIESLIGLAGESLQFESLRVCRKVRESNVIANEWDKEIEGLRRVVKDCVVTRCMDDKATKILFLRRITELCAFCRWTPTLTLGRHSETASLVWRSSSAWEARSSSSSCRWRICSSTWSTRS